jgi:deoxyribonucleoside regulator
MDKVTIELKVKIAKMYYLKKMSLSEIGDRLSVSRFKVARLLRAAEEEGIVQIRVLDPIRSGGEHELAAELERRFNLQEAIVIDVPDDAGDWLLKERLGQAGAQYLHRTLQDGDLLGVSWGTTVAQVVDQMVQFERQCGFSVVQVVGNSQEVALHISAGENVRRLATAVGTRCHLLHAPMTVTSEQLRHAIEAEPDIASTLKLYDHLSVILVGVSSFQPLGESLYVMAARLTQADVTILRRAGVVGEICSLFYDENGQIIDNELMRRSIGITADQFRKCKKVVAAAGGVDKVLPLQGLLRGDLIRVLVTDRRTALAVLGT